MAAVQGPFQDVTTPTEAVARACTSQGVAPDNVEIEPFDHPSGTRAWHWNLTPDAPEVELRDVLVLETVVDLHGCPRATGRAHHPKLNCGVVIEVDGGLLVVADDVGGGEQVENLIAAGIREARTAT